MISEYLTTLDKIDRAEQDLKELKQSKEEQAEKIFHMFAAEGAGKLSIHGVTVSPKRVMRAHSRDMQALIEALKSEGFDPLVSETVNAQRLTGWVNEFDPDRMCGVDELLKRLPEGVRDYIGLYEQLTLSVLGRKQ